MKYLNKSFSVGGPLNVTQKEWDSIFAAPPSGPRFPVCSVCGREVRTFAAFVVTRSAGVEDKWQHAECYDLKETVNE